MSTTTTPPSGDVLPFLDAMLNLTAFHREHEKYYSVEPRERAVVLQRHARALHALADRWSSAVPSTGTPLSPYQGAPDLDAFAAIQLDGVLFMEGEGEPNEIRHMKREVPAYAEDAEAAGGWLDQAMSSSWDVAKVLLEIDGVADLLGERHRIVANNWQGAATMTLAARILLRAADVLDCIDFRPAALRADLAAHRLAAARSASAAEMLDHAADLLSEFAGLVHDNERRWRVFRGRIAEIVEGESTPSAEAGS